MGPVNSSPVVIQRKYHLTRMLPLPIPRIGMNIISAIGFVPNILHFPKIPASWNHDMHYKWEFLKDQEKTTRLSGDLQPFSIFNFHDYREYLSAYYKHKKKLNH